MWPDLGNHGFYFQKPETVKKAKKPLEIKQHSKSQEVPVTSHQKKCLRRSVQQSVNQTQFQN